MLRLDVVAMPRVIARVAAILAHRQFDVLAMDVAAPVDGLRTITIEVDTADEIRLDQLVNFLNRSPEVVKVARLGEGSGGVAEPARPAHAAAAERPSRT